VLRLGAKGYLKKENLIHAIYCISEGGIYHEETNFTSDDKKSFEEKLSRYYTLTDADKEVFKLLTIGKKS
jgi:hypothetical protein